jgi:thiamine kinase-like enzyme
VKEVAEALYVNKVEERVARLMAMPVGAQVDGLIRAGTPYDGLVHLVEVYRARLQDHWNVHGHGDGLAVTHGDLCFSNILYDRRSGLLRFIDPRGAVTEDETFSDPYYDIAKLSHSIMGGYDFVNSELFDVRLDPALMLTLTRNAFVPDARQEYFLHKAAQAGFDPVRMRLYEASLFLSMLPLHADVPAKLVAFSLIAVQILESLSESAKSTSGWRGWLGMGVG